MVQNPQDRVRALRLTLKALVSMYSCCVLPEAPCRQPGHDRALGTSSKPSPHSLNPSRRHINLNQAPPKPEALTKTSIVQRPLNPTQTILAPLATSKHKFQTTRRPRLFALQSASRCKEGWVQDSRRTALRFVGSRKLD